jgi:hypothetical protein
MSSTTAVTFVAFLVVGLLLGPSETSARSAEISQRAVAPLSPAGTQCFGAGCGLPGPLPSVSNSFFRPQFRAAPLRRDHRGFRHRRLPYDIGFTSGDWPLGDYSTYPAPYVAPAESGPRGCTSQDYSVPSEYYVGSRIVTVTRCHGM